MAAVHPIVSIGLDLPLLFDRAAILRSSGYAVVTLSPDTPSLEVLLRRQPPLVLICHTVRGKKLENVLRKTAKAGVNVLELPSGRVDSLQLVTQVEARLAAAPAARGARPRLVSRTPRRRRAAAK